MPAESCILKILLIGKILTRIKPAVTLSKGLMLATTLCRMTGVVASAVHRASQYTRILLYAYLNFLHMIWRPHCVTAIARCRLKESETMDAAI
jgi:hypothetical protein